MKNEQKTNNNVKFTKELYVSTSRDITEQITQIKQDKEDIISRIQSRKEELKQLKEAIAKRNALIDRLYGQICEVKINITNEKRLLSADKKEKFALTRKLVTNKNNSKKINALYAKGSETIDIAKFYPEKKQQNNTEVKFTEELYIAIANNMITQIAKTKQDKEDVISKIEGRKEYLNGLKAKITKINEEINQLNKQISDIRLKITNEKRLLRSDKKEKFALTRKLVSKKNDSKKLNTLFVNGEETIDISRFYPVKQQKTR